MLQKIITDKNLVWNKYSSSKLENFVVKISNNAITELKNNRNFLNNSEYSFSILQKEILDFKKKFLVDGIGFFVINGKCFVDFSKEELTEIYENVCKILGTLMILFLSFTLYFFLRLFNSLPKRVLSLSNVLS